MKNYVKILLLVLLTAGTASFLLAQHPNVSKFFTTSNGLSDNSAICALRDRYGMLWVGTENGLNYFDGSRIKAYFDMAGDTNTDEANSVISIYEHDDDIWLGGTAGLYILNRQSNTYHRFDHRTRYGVMISSAVSKMLGTPQNNIWILTHGQGIFVYDTKTDSLHQDSRHGSFFCDAKLGSDGLVYAATLSGNLVVYRADGQIVREYQVGGYENDKNPICLAVSGNTLWLGYNTSILRLTTDSIMTQATLPATGSIHSLCADNSGNLIIGSDDGVFRYAPKSGQLDHISQTEAGQSMLSDNTVNSILWDSDSTLLVLTKMGGINMMSVKQSGLVYVPLPQRIVSGRNIVKALCRGSNDQLWIGTEHGLYRAFYETKKIEPYAQGQLNEEITSLALDGNDLWIGTRHHGLRILNTTTGKVTSLTYSANKPYTIPSNEVNSIYRTREGEIYVLTSWGLNRYDRATGHFYGYASISAMTSFICMEEASNGWLWASSGNRGLYCKRVKGGGFERFMSEALGKQTVVVLHQDSRGDLWAAVNGGGLYRYNADKEDFERYNNEHSILNNQVVSFIEEDDQGVLWLGTSAGIIRVSPSRDVRDVQVFEQMPNYDAGLLRHSSCAHGYGQILFGADGGIYKFTANSLHSANRLQRVYVNDISFPFAADNQAELDRLGLDVLLYTRKSIELPFSDNSFTLHFASTFYSDTPTPQFEYMLEGIDKTWAHGTGTEATYAKLPPGNYTFLLRDAHQTDKASMARLEITILPPWYRTTLAYIIYALLVIAAAAAINLFAQRRIRQRYQRQMNDFQQQQEKETFQSKIRFFIDLVHEIRTPLTLMSLPLEAMEEATDPETSRKSLAAVRRNMHYLLGVTNQLLDFQKQENGGITLVCKPTDIGEMLLQIYDQFSEALKVQGKHIEMQLPDEPVVLSIDSDKMMKVMMNLVGNAQKYTKDTIIIRLSKKGNDFVEIAIIDNGDGVAIEDRDKIFDRYYQIANEKANVTLGTGLGLAYARMIAEAHGGSLNYEDAPGGGACFITKLSTHPTTQAIQEIGKSKEKETNQIVETEASRQFRVLLVEDNEELLKATADSIKKWYKVLKARDGLEALDLLKYQEVDVIVSDVMMPRMDGTTLCRQLKQDIETSHIPVILLTAKVTVEAKVEGMESGADIYLEKPFSIRQLHLQIENLLRLRQQFYQRMRKIDGSQSTTVMEEKPLGLNEQDMQFVNNMQKSVAENMHDEEYTIDTLAEQLNMSRSSFYRKIKALTGMTPVDYLKTARMNEAARLLGEGMRSSEVAERVGFTSSSYFAKCFRAQFGCLPKDYKAK